MSRYIMVLVAAVATLNAKDSHAAGMLIADGRIYFKSAADVIMWDADAIVRQADDADAELEPEWQRAFAADPVLTQLQARSVAWHRARIETLRDAPDTAAFFEAISADPVSHDVAAPEAEAEEPLPAPVPVLDAEVFPLRKEPPATGAIGLFQDILTERPRVVVVIFLGFLCFEESVAVHCLLDILKALAGILHIEIVHPRLDA